MGQNNQILNTPILKNRSHQRSSTHISNKALLSLNSIKIVHKNTEKEILIEDSSMTCGWLLSEAIRAYSDIHNIVALRSLERSDFTDAWLLYFERSINILKDGATLTPVIGNPVAEEMSLEWFNFISLIGKGGFSEVFLVRKKDDGCLYALKAMKKSHIIKEKKIGQAINECLILKSMVHPFIISLKWAFQTVT